MNNTTKVYMIMAMTGIMTMVLTQTTEAEAWNRRRGYGHKKHSHYNHGYYNQGHKPNRSHHPYISGNLVFPFPKGFIKISVGGERYHFHDGVFANLWRNCILEFEP